MQGGGRGDDIERIIREWQGVWISFDEGDLLEPAPAGFGVGQSQHLRSPVNSCDMPGVGGECERSKTGAGTDVQNLVIRFRSGESNESGA